MNTNSFMNKPSAIPKHFLYLSVKTDDMILCHPNAKINLGLNVTERRPDGYHNLETIFYPIPVCDTLKIEIAGNAPSPADDEIFPDDCRTHTETTDDYTLTTGGITIDCPPEKNLLIKALRNLKQDFDIPRLHINMHKQIPSGAGLGGGSSDAAYMMKAVNTLLNLGLSTRQMEQRVAGLGADCAFFINNRPIFATGIGNVFSPTDLSLSGWHLVLVKPDIFVSTKEAYAQIHPHQPETPVTDIIRQPVENWKDTLDNDFETGIFSLHPEIGAIKSNLYELGAAYAAMSGSGSSVFGLFRQTQDDAALARLFSGCFYRQCTL